MILLTYSNLIYYLSFTGKNYKSLAISIVYNYNVINKSLIILGININRYCTKTVKRTKNSKRIYADKYQQILYENCTYLPNSIIPPLDKYQQILYENLLRTYASLSAVRININRYCTKTKLCFFHHELRRQDKYQQILYENYISPLFINILHRDKYQQILYENFLASSTCFKYFTININRYCTKTFFPCSSYFE